MFRLAINFFSLFFLFEKIEHPKKVKNSKKKPILCYFQYEHESFWSYFTRVNDLSAHLVDQKFEKWKIFEVVYVDVNGKTRAIFNLLCFLSKNLDEA